MTFERGDGARVRRPVTLPAGRSLSITVGAVIGLEAADVSTTVESNRFVGVERSMTWGTTAGAIYGSHAETATAAPSPTWFLAEGSTVLEFNLFYLLQNPQATTTSATVRFLLPSGTTITRTYSLPPGSRTTIYVNEIQGLDETDVSGEVTAERADRRRTGHVPEPVRPAVRARPRLDGGDGDGDVVVPGRGRDRRVLRSLRADRESRQHQRDGARRLRSS